jgi:hypothetical protein
MQSLSRICLAKATNLLLTQDAPLDGVAAFIRREAKQSAKGVKQPVRGVWYSGQLGSLVPRDVVRDLAGSRLYDYLSLVGREYEATPLNEDAFVVSLAYICNVRGDLTDTERDAIILKVLNTKLKVDFCYKGGPGVPTHGKFISL